MNVDLNFCLDEIGEECDDKLLLSVRMKHFVEEIVFDKDPPV